MCINCVEVCVGNGSKHSLGVWLRRMYLFGMAGGYVVALSRFQCQGEANLFSENTRSSFGVLITRDYLYVTV